MLKLNAIYYYFYFVFKFIIIILNRTVKLGYFLRWLSKCENLSNCCNPLHAHNIEVYYYCIQIG